MTEFFGPWDGQPEDGEVVETTETVETVTTTTKKTRSAPVGPRLWLRPWSWLAHQVYFCSDLFRADLHGICKKTQKKNLLKLEFSRDGWNIFIASVSLSEVFILDRLSVTGAVNACPRWCKAETTKVKATEPVRCHQLDSGHRFTKKSTDAPAAV